MALDINGDTIEDLYPWKRWHVVIDQKWERPWEFAVPMDGQHRVFPLNRAPDGHRRWQMRRRLHELAKKTPRIINPTR